MTTLTNAPESDALTLEDHTIFENSRAAVALMKKNFESWMLIARGVKRARDIADRRGGRHTFQRLLEQQGLAVALGRNWQTQKSTASRLIQIIDNYAAVVAWRETLTDGEKHEWSGPQSIINRCPVFNKPKTKEEKAAAKANSPSAKKDRAIADLQEENDRLKKEMRNRQDGDRFKKTDTARDVAVVLADMFSPSKAEAIMKEWKKLLPLAVPSISNGKARKAAAPPQGR